MNGDGVIGFTFASDWSREWSNFRRPMTEQEKRSNSGFLTTLYDQNQEEHFEFPFTESLHITFFTLQNEFVVNFDQLSEE